MSLSIENRNNSFALVSEKLSKKRKMILSFIKENEPCTSQEIVDKYWLTINEVSGRITELKEMCLITEQGSKKNTHSKCLNTVYVSVKNEDERIDLINLKYQELIDNRDAIIRDYQKGISEFSRAVLDKEIKKIKGKISRLEKSAA